MNNVIDNTIIVNCHFFSPFFFIFCLIGQLSFSLFSFSSKFVIFSNFFVSFVHLEEELDLKNFIFSSFKNFHHQKNI